MSGGASPAIDPMKVGGIRSDFAPGSCGDAAGFTLLEVLVTLVILSTGIVLVLRAFDHAMVALDNARDVMRMSFLAEQHLAAIDVAQRPLEAGYGTCEEPYAGYRWELAVNPVPGADGPLLEWRLGVRREGRAGLYERRGYALQP